MDEDERDDASGVPKPKWWLWYFPFEITEDAGNTPVRFAPHARTPAVAYRLDAGQLAKLDDHEGTPKHYLRLAIVFTATDGTKELMQAYLAHPDRLLGPCCGRPGTATWTTS